MVCGFRWLVGIRRACDAFLPMPLRLRLPLKLFLGVFVLFPDLGTASVLPAVARPGGRGRRASVADLDLMAFHLCCVCARHYALADRTMGAGRLTIPG